MKLKCLGKPFT